MEVIHPERSHHFMPFAPGIKVRAGSKMLYVSGCTALPLYHAHPHVPADLHFPDDVREQTRLVMENLKKVLDAAGATFRDVVCADVFVTNIDDQDKIGEVMGEYFQGHFPTSTMVEVRRLVVAGLKLEVNATAELPG
jgi:enamine deaminase RidA (YjgF/YER057c/UK114 family)